MGVGSPSMPPPRWPFSRLTVFLCVILVGSVRGFAVFTTLGLNSRPPCSQKHVHNCAVSHRTPLFELRASDAQAGEGDHPPGLSPCPAHELAMMTWMEVKSYVDDARSQNGTAAAVVPVGATEQHGPTGLIGTDHQTAEAVARGVAAATGAVLVPCINVGMSVHHSGFPGTLTLSPSTFVAVVRDHVASLRRSGFTHVLFINGHGGNVMPMIKAFRDHAEDEGTEQGAEETRRETQGEARLSMAAAGGGGRLGTQDLPGGGRLQVHSWYTGRRSSELAQELYGDEIGQHATPDEVAVTMALFPEHIKGGGEALLDPAAIQVAGQLRGRTKRVVDAATGLPIMDAQDFARRFPDGRMGSNPALATPEHGARLLGAAIADGVDVLQNLLAGSAAEEERKSGHRDRQPHWGRSGSPGAKYKRARGGEGGGEGEGGAAGPPAGPSTGDGFASGTGGPTAGGTSGFSFVTTTTAAAAAAGAGGAEAGAP